MNKWSDDDDALLRSLWLDLTLSASKIGKRMGRTKGSILGRAYRLELFRRKPAREKVERIKASRLKVQHERERDVANSTINTALRRVMVARARAHGRLAPRELTPHSGRKDLIKFARLERHSCRWPYGHVGDHNFGFCGRKRKGVETPYCAKHHRMAYRPL